MVRRRNGWVLALGLLAGLLGGPARAGEKEPPSLADIEKASRPGPEHKVLDPLAGEWTYTAKCWMKPGEGPQEMSGKSTRRWILGGRFLQEEVGNEKPAADFKGLGLTGYDKARKKYTVAWVDSMTTAIQTSYGSVDKDGKVFTYRNEALCPLTNQNIKGRDVLRIVDQDKHVLEMYKELDGKEVKVMEITYARQK
jgi:hypothetical protein